jgi:hypothetical protein
MTDPFETIPHEQLAQTHGGRSTVNELVSFARRYGFHVTSTTGGRHSGWAHRAGRAADVRTRGKSATQINMFIRRARAAGIHVIDERRGGNRLWTGPHLHLQK